MGVIDDVHVDPEDGPPSPCHPDMSTCSLLENIQENSPPSADRIWGMWGCHYNLPKAIFYLVKGGRKACFEIRRV